MKSFIFALDGTVIDSRLDIAESVNLALERHGFEKLPVERIISYVGRGVKTLISRVLGEKAGNGSIERVVNTFREVYLHHLAVHTKLYDGIEEILELISSQGGNIFILTNKPSVHTQEILRRFGVEKYLSAWFGGDTLPELKPSPAGFFRLQKLFLIDNFSSYMIGDSAVDEEFARNSKIPFIFVDYGGFIQEEDRRSISTTFRAATTVELRRIIEKILADGD